MVGEKVLAVLEVGVGVGEGKEEGNFGSETGQPTISFFVLLVLPHGFEPRGTSESLMGEATLVVGLRAIFSVDVLVSLRGVV